MGMKFCLMQSNIDWGCYRKKFWGEDLYLWWHKHSENYITRRIIVFIQYL